MKKYAAFLLALIMVVTVFSGCDNKDVPSSTPPVNDGGTNMEGGGTEGSPSVTPPVNDADTPTDSDNAADSSLTLYAKDLADNGFELLIPGAEKDSAYTFTAVNSEGITWEVYVLDEEWEYGSPLRFMSQITDPVLVGDGTVSVTTGQFVYVYCSANGFTTVCTDENVKLVITETEYVPALHTEATLYAKDFVNSGYELLIPGAGKDSAYTFTAVNSEGITWEVYVLDDEFTDGLRYLDHAAEPVLVGDGTVSVTAGQFVYVYCSANGRTTVCTDENVKLIITECESEPVTDAEVQIAEQGWIYCNGDWNTKMAFDINQDGKFTLHMENWNEDHLIEAVSLADTEINLIRARSTAIHNEHACFFLELQDKVAVVKFEKGSPNETVTTLDVGKDVIEVCGNFISENIGYLFVFEEVIGGFACGGAHLSNLFITEDGGTTWNRIDVQDVPLLNRRETVHFAKMISEDVGLISGNACASDYNFCERTLLTTDGGRTWAHVADLPQINDLLWANAIDFTLLNDTYDIYVLKIRYTAEIEPREYGYAEYILFQNTWIRVT